jgi:hypothetical protein
MPRRPCRSSQRDLTRAIRAARAAGVEVSRAEVDAAGKISIVVGKPEAIGSAAQNPLDDWIVAHARKSQGH